MKGLCCFWCIKGVPKSPPPRSRYTLVDRKTFSLVFQERVKAMKAVELEVSVISDCLGDTMVPKAEVEDPIGKQCNGTKPRTESPVRSNGMVDKEKSPLRICSSTLCSQINGSSKVNGFQNGIEKEVNGDKEKIFQNSVLRQSSITCSQISNVTLHNGVKKQTESSYSSMNGTVDSRQQNGVDKSIISSPRKDEGIKVLTVSNGITTDGFHKGDDEKFSLESLTDVEAEGSIGKRSRSPPEDIPRLQADSGLESAASSWDQAEARLRDELLHAREQLKLKDDEVLRLTRIRQEVESELEELTASLFQEAHAMVRVANERQASAEKALRESSMQVEVLTAEVSALKTLVLTSTPSRPNPHLHPQIDPKAKEESNSSGNPLFRKHRRSPSHFNLKYGRESSPPESPTRDPRPAAPPAEPVDLRDGSLEVDPALYREFLAWKENPTTDHSDPFIARVYQEDINSCLTFSNRQLAAEVQAAVESDSIYIEAVNEKRKTHFPKKCALLEVPRMCQYRMRLGDTDTWHSISHVCRNRIIAVCDFLNYLKYIQRGLVKSSVNEVYWEMVKLRKEMVLARLGLPLSS